VALLDLLLEVAVLRREAIAEVAELLVREAVVDRDGDRARDPLDERDGIWR
jgi:hypothetical protein